MINFPQESEDNIIWLLGPLIWFLEIWFRKSTSFYKSTDLKWFLQAFLCKFWQVLIYREYTVKSFWKWNTCTVTHWRKIYIIMKQNHHVLLKAFRGLGYVLAWVESRGLLENTEAQWNEDTWDSMKQEFWAQSCYLISVWHRAQTLAWATGLFVVKWSNQECYVGKWPRMTSAQSMRGNLLIS